MSNRREVFRQTAALTVGLAASDAEAVFAQQRGAKMPTPRASALMTLFGLKYPISNAGMAGAAGPELAIAVSNAGGLGAIGTPSGSPDVIRGRVSQTRSGTNRPFAVNYLLGPLPAQLDAFLERIVAVALDAGAPIIQFAWGIPPRDTVAAIRDRHAKMGVQVGSAAGARRALDLGAEYLICQGTEAGGHVQATRTLYEALPAVLEEAKTVPVLAAGGIANGSHIRRALQAGASGVLIGTRFVATKEAAAHDEYKALVTRAKAADTVLTVCFHDGWPNAPHRALRNRTFEMWEAAGCPPDGRRPGEGDILATNASTGATRRRYSGGSPVRDDQGAIADMALFAGQGVDAIRDITESRII